MRGAFKHVLADKIIKWGMLCAVVILVSQVLIILAGYFFLPPFIPLFNQLPWGEARLGTRFEIFLPVLITVSFFFLNMVLLTKIYEKVPLLSRILSVTMILTALLSAIFVIRTLLLVL